MALGFIELAGELRDEYPVSTPYARSVLVT